MLNYVCEDRIPLQVPDPTWRRTHLAQLTLVKIVEHDSVHAGVDFVFLLAGHVGWPEKEKEETAVCKGHLLTSELRAVLPKRLAVDGRRAAWS